MDGGKWAVLKPSEQKFKLSEESALGEMQRLCDYYDVNITALPEEQIVAVDQVLAKLLTAFKTGRLELKEDDKGLSVIQNLRNGETLTYRELAGKDKARLNLNPDNLLKAVHTLMGLLCGLGEDVTGKLSGPDLKAMEGLGQYFLALC